MELNREHFRAIIFYNFRCGLTQQQCTDELNPFLAMKLHQEPVFIDGTANSTEVVVHSKTNFMKVVQNQLLFPKPLMLCANWHWKIVMWSIVRLRQPLLVGRAYIQYCMNICLSKKFIRLGSHTICPLLKKRLVQIDRKKCPKNMIAVLRNTSMASWQVMISGFTRMSSKVNSSRLCCMGASRWVNSNKSCSRKKHFQANSIFSEKLDMSQSFH